jgi:hypothetical protein
LIEKLTCFGGTHPDLNEHARKLVDDAISALTSLQERIRKLEEALKPFASWEDEELEGAPDDLTIEEALFAGSQPKVGDLRRARALLSGGSEG